LDAGSSDVTDRGAPVDGNAMKTLVGRPLLRREDPRMVRGEAIYLDDIRRPGMAHAVFVRSHHAYAAITAIRGPEHVPGLLAVITARELRGRVQPFPVGAPPDVELADAPHPVLAEEEVRYVGQPVAAVIASSPAQAKDAAELVEVDYAPRPPILDAGASEFDLTRWRRSGGDVAAAFAQAARVVRGRYGLPRLVAAPIEPRGVIAEHDADADRLTVWCSMQDPHRPRAQLSHLLERDAERLRVIVPDVGGAFGSKGVIPAEAVVAAIAAIDLERPVKWVEERTENFLGAYQGRGIVGELELCFDEEGRMLGLRAALTADLGAYLLPNTAIPAHTAAALLTGCYDIPAASVTVVGKRTNKVPTGPYRGAGRPDAAYLLESLIDDAARQLGLDRTELRRRNLIREFPHRTPLGLSYDSGDYERCLDTALSLLDAGAAARSVLSGIGTALYVERAAGQWESATASLEPGGDVAIASSASPHGQGHEITFAQIAADRLGVGIDRIALRFGDSDRVPPGVGTFGSRSTAVAGSAVALAAGELLEQGRRLVGHLLGFSPGAVDYRDGRFAAGGRGVEWAELARFAHDPARLPPGVDVGLRVTARFDSELVFSSGAYAAAVEIDPETGRLTVRRIVAVDDAGTIINPLLAHGQVIGGAVQGLGECVIEEAIYDEDGQLRTATFMDYGLLTAADIPEILTGEVVSPSPRNPLGAKGVGEGGTIGTLPAVANAVADALGGRRVDPPYEAEKLWRALPTRAPAGATRPET
jgi:carbon-monoxide dehydrogenase large subunit